MYEIKMQNIRPGVCYCISVVSQAPAKEIAIALNPPAVRKLKKYAAAGLICKRLKGARCFASLGERL